MKSIGKILSWVGGIILSINLLVWVFGPSHIWSWSIFIIALAVFIPGDILLQRGKR